MRTKSIMFRVPGEIRGQGRPYRKPDVDNVAKIFRDAMNSVVYPDDRMVTQLHVAKVFSDIDSVYVTVS